MANETVSFEITANTQNAGKAITELQRKLNAIARIKTDDTGVKKQQKVFAQMNKDLGEILEREGQLGRHYTTYDSRAKRVAKLTTEYENQDKVLQENIARQEELQAKSDAGTITPKEVNELSRVTATVDNLTTKQTDALKKINAEKKKNEALDKNGKKVLAQLVSQYGEIKADESSILGLKVEQAKGTEQAVASESALDKEVNKTNSSLDKQAQSAKRAKSEFDKATNKSNRTKNIKQIVDEADDIETKISKIEKRASHVLSQPMGPDKFDFGLLKNRRTELEMLKQTIESIGTPKELHGIYDQVIRELDSVKRGEQALHKETQKTNAGVIESTKQTVSAAETAEKQIQEVVTKANSALSQPAPEGPLQRDDLDRRIAQLREIQNTIKQLGIPPELKGQYNQISEELIRLGQAKKELDKAVKTPIKPEVDTTEVKSLQAVMQETATTTARIDEAMKTEPATNNLAELIRRLNELNVAKKALEELNLPAGTDATYNKIIQLIAVLNSQVADYKRNLTGVAEKHEKTKKSGTNFTKSVSAGVKSLKSAMSKLDKASSKVKSSFDGMARSMRSNFKHLITSITKYVLGFRSLFFLIRRLRKYIGEGIQNMAQFNDGNNHVNDSITRLLSSLLYLKNAWATAFSPILQFVTPVLEMLLDKLAAAGNAFSRFLGSLLGQETVFQAVKVDAQSYADSLDNAAGSAGSAADKTKKLTDRLAAFDDLNVLGKDTDPDGTGSGGGGGGADAYVPDPNEMFELVNVSQSVLDKLKQMWAAADFSEIGNTVKDKIIKTLRGIDWTEIQETARKVGKSFGTFFAGAFRDSTLFVEIGHTIAEGLDTVTYAIEKFFAEIQAVDFGGNISKGINQFFFDWDYETAFQNVVTAITTFRDNVISFLKNLNWKGVMDASGTSHGGIFAFFEEFGTTFGQIISETLGNAELVQWIANGAGNLVNAIVRSFQSTLDATSGEEIGNAIYSFFETLLDTIEWDKLSGVISDGLILALNALTQVSDNLANDSSLQSALSAFVEGLNLDSVFEALGKNISSSTIAATSIADAIVTILNNQDFIDTLISGTGTLLENLDLSGLTDSLTTFTGHLIALLITALADPTVPFKLLGAIIDGLSTALANGLENTAKSVEGEDTVAWFEEPGWMLVEGLAKGIGDAIEQVFSVVASPFIAIEDGFCELFGIHSPSTVFEGFGINIIEGLLNGINSLIETVMEPFTTLQGNLATKWVEIKISAAQKWQEIKDKIAEKAEALRDSLSTKWQEIKDNAYEKFVLMRVSIVEVFNVLKEAIKSPVNGIISIIENMVNFVIRGINKLIGGIDTATSGLGNLAGTLGLPTITIPTLSEVSLPRLAQGAVIPPNREFMAVLGDQSHGTNIEAPLDTIKQAVAEVIANNGNAEMIALLQQLITVVENKNLTIGDKEIGKANARYNKQQNIIRGTSF